MSVEIKVLACAGLLQVVQFFAMAIAMDRQLGFRYNAGPRDEQRPLTGHAGRLKRAYENHVEALILFAIATVVVTLGDANTSFTAACAWTYLGARIAYVPAYVSGIFLLRTIVWFVGLAATVALLVSGI